MRDCRLYVVLLLACCLLAGCGYNLAEDLPTVNSLRDLSENIGHRVRVRGTAVGRMKGGTYLVGEDYGMFLVGVPEWEDAEVGQVFMFSGRVRMRTVLPQPEGELARAADFGPGDVYFLDDCVRIPQ